MAVKGGLLFFLVLLSVSWVCADAKSSIVSDSLDAGNDVLCTLCQQASNVATTYLGSNMTQPMVIDILKLHCIDLSALSAECKILVDYYVPLIFTRITKQLKSGDICRRFQMCDELEDVMDTLEIRDLCSSNHACKITSMDGNGEVSWPAKISMQTEP